MVGREEVRHIPKSGDWPGGDVYEYEVHLYETKRDYSLEEKVEAFHRNERLCTWWRVRQQTWKDDQGKLWGMREYIKPLW